MFRRSRGVWGLGLLAFLGLFLFTPAQNVRAQEGGKQPAVKKYVRLKQDAGGKPVAFQTAISRFAAKGDVKVDLIGVVHIGERQYYEKLNDLFKEYDVVLYEMAGGPKKGKPSPLDDLNFDPLNLFYKYLANTMKIEQQMRVIDYSAPNFVHADLDWKDVPEILNKRGDNLLSLFLTIVADLIREHNLEQARLAKGGKKPEKLDPFAFSGPTASYKLRLGMAKELVESGDGLGLGKTVDLFIIDYRNEACLKVLQKQLAAGKKKIAIFYGAAHMPDFEQRLLRDFQMREQSVDWVTAWEIIDPRKRDGEKEKQ
jgi:hypothetical protein